MAPPDNRPKVAEDSVRRFTVGPALQPPPVGGEVVLLDRLAGLKHQAFDLGWITDQGIVNSLDQKLDNARRKVQQGQRKAAINLLQAFLQELDAQRGKHLDDKAYHLLRPNVEYLMTGLTRTSQSGVEGLALGVPGSPCRHDADQPGAAGAAPGRSTGPPPVRPRTAVAIQSVALSGLLGLVVLPGFLRRRGGHMYSWSGIE